MAIAVAILGKRGYVVRPALPVESETSDVPHAPVHTEATYSPWLADSEFLAAYSAVEKATLVDRYRCYELWQLVGETSKLERGAMLQVGVWRGGTGALMAKRAQLLGVKAPLFLCDTFTGVVKAGARDTRYTGGEHADTDVAEVESLIRKMNLSQIEILPGVFPDDTGRYIEAETFRLAHIDVDVYQSTRDILEWLWPRMMPNGCVVFDDYGMHGCEGITRLLEEQRLYQDRMLIHNLNGHGLLIKLNASSVGAGATP